MQRFISDLPMRSSGDKSGRESNSIRLDEGMCTLDYSSETFTFNMKAKRNVSISPEIISTWIHRIKWESSSLTKPESRINSNVDVVSRKKLVIPIWVLGDGILSLILWFRPRKSMIQIVLIKYQDQVDFLGLICSERNKIFHILVRGFYIRSKTLWGIIAYDP